MIPDIELVKYSKDLSGTDGDTDIIILHSKYLADNGTLHPLASNRVKVYFNEMEITCDNVDLYTPDFPCGNTPILTINADNSLSFVVDSYVNSLIALKNASIVVDVDGTQYTVSTTDNFLYSVDDSINAVDNSSAVVKILMDIGDKVCTHTYSGDIGNIVDNTTPCHETEVVPTVIINTLPLVTFTLPQEISQQINGYNVTSFVTIDELGQYPVYVYVDGVTYAITIPDSSAYEDLLNLPMVLHITNGVDTCSFPLGTYNECVLSDVLDELPAGYTVVHGDGVTVISIETVTDIRNSPYSLTYDEFKLPILTTTLEVDYTMFESRILPSDCKSISTIDDLDFTSISVRTETIDYGISDPEHFPIYDMIDTTNEMPTIALITYQQYLGLTAGTIPLAPLRSIYIVQRTNGLETYMVRTIGIEIELLRISDEVYDNQVEYQELISGQEYQCPCIGVYMDSLDRQSVYTNLHDGVSTFSPVIRDGLQDVTATSEVPNVWFTPNFNNKPLVERIIF